MMEADAIEIRRDRDHYAVYVDGVFFCTADTYVEAINELKKEGKIA